MTRSSADKQMAVAKIILETLVKGTYQWSDLLKVVIAKNPTYSKFQGALRYLLRNKYVKRPKRGVYQITAKGRKLLEALSFEENTSQGEV